MKMIQLFISVFLLTGSISHAQNIDIRDAHQVFSASGQSENFDSSEAIELMLGNAQTQCFGLGLPRQLNPVRLRTSYGGRTASAYFDCLKDELDLSTINNKNQAFESTKFCCTLICGGRHGDTRSHCRHIPAEEHCNKGPKQCKV